jgi:hypothetical protein
MRLLYDTPELRSDEDTKQHKLEWLPTPQELITKQVAYAIAQDREGKIRRALIELGWTPPSEDTDGESP